MSDPESRSVNLAASRPTMQSLDEALARLLGAVAPVCAHDAEQVSTFDALGRILATEIRSALDVPPADNTSMDGYAVRAADVAVAGAVMPVSQRIPAGVVGAALQPGTAARIFTGAQVPAGADAVVMQELCDVVSGEPLADAMGRVAGAATLPQIRVNAVPSPGQWIRRRGEDVAQGAVVLPVGARLTAAALGLAATVGAATVSVARRPRVALFSTGDELVMPGTVPPEQMPPGAIYNSNRYTLRALLTGLGCEVQDLGIVPDQLEATRAALRQAATGNDLIVTSGGVSVGEEDHLRPAMLAEGRLDLWQIAMKPGKPLAFGAVRRPVAAGSVGEALYLGLPGNPVSSFVTFLLLVRPVLLRLQGATDVAPRGMAVRADFDLPRPDKRREFVRVRLKDDGGVELFPNQSSGVLTSAVWADGLVDIPAGQTVQRGDSVSYLPFTALL